MNDLTLGRIGFMILICGSPFYFTLFYNGVDSFNENHVNILPLWASIIITIAFSVGCILYFTTKDEDITVLIKGDAN